MSKMTTMTLFITALIIIGGFFIFYNTKSASGPTQDNSLASDSQQKWETKVDEQVGVTVTVTPLNPSFDSKEWAFDVVLNTHSVELNQNMTEIAVLVDDQGKEYPALKWEGSEPGGHHREGVLIFEAINPIPSHLELKIKKVGEVLERSFRWDLE